jgi:type IV pilus assembly protein PilW
MRCTGARGFTLIELMIGLAVGLFATLAITQIMTVAEGQKRSAMAGSDAQISGVLALATLRQSIEMAGYGFSSEPASLGCPIQATFNGAVVAGFPADLVPLIITNGAGGAPDTIRILGSAKTSFSAPVRLTGPYDHTNNLRKYAFPVASMEGLQPGDLMLAVTDATTACEMFQATAVPAGAAALVQVPRADDVAHWNATGFPFLPYDVGQFLVNFGTLVDITYSVSAAGALQSNNFVLDANSAPTYTGPIDLFANVVNLQAYYGKDTGFPANGAIDTWDTTTPTTNAGWRQVRAVRVAVASRSVQYEKEEVTATNPLWDVGADSVILGAASCGASKCLELKVDQLADWKHYRYKVFDTIVPLRNMLWNNS